jgi:hypothetical protein
MRITPWTFTGGDHACALYSGPVELAQLASEFLLQGLKRGDRCYCVAADGEAATVKAMVRSEAARLDVAIRTGALATLSPTDCYVINGVFDPIATVKTFSELVEAARQDGFTGLRVAAEMSWALTVPDGVQRVITYEASLRPVFETVPATALCLYDRERMPIAALNGALASHPIAGVDGDFHVNPFFVAAGKH